MLTALQVVAQVVAQGYPPRRDTVNTVLFVSRADSIASSPSSPTPLRSSTTVRSVELFFNMSATLETPLSPRLAFAMVSLRREPDTRSAVAMRAWGVGVRACCGVREEERGRAVVRGSKSEGVHILVGVGSDGVERDHGDPEGCEGVRGDDGLVV